MRLELKYLATRSGKSLLLDIDGKKYAFGLFEGFQRYCVETHTALSKISSVFLQCEDSVPALVGIYLTLRDAQRKDLDVICDRGLWKVIDSANSFADRMHMKINCSEAYEDRFIRVESIRNNGTESSFIIHPAPIRGKFLVDKVPRDIPKQYYSELSRRRTVEWNGEVHDGNRYVEEDVDIGAIAVVYSTGNHLDLLEKLCGEQVRYVFCFQEQAARFLISRMDCSFFILDDNHFVEYNSVYKSQLGLNQIDQNFLVPLMPARPDHAAQCVYLQSQDTLTYNRNSRSFDHNGFDQQVHHPCSVESVPVSILFLGTGCALPSKYRNVSGILYESDDKAIILDCGEDTLFQIHRAYGNIDVVRKVTTIFISHSHADHVLGIVSILKHTEQFVKVFGPSLIREFIEQFDLHSHEFVETDHAKTLERRYGTGVPDKDVEKYCMRFRCEFDISICGVRHSPDSCGIKVRDANMSLSYSGDCRPSTLFQKMSSDVDVMIHEATFGQDQHDKALQSRHSTIQEATRLFDMSSSRHLLLTHFSQRYPKAMVLHKNCTPCVDLFRYVPGHEYPSESINRYHQLEEE